MNNMNRPKSHPIIRCARDEKVRRTRSFRIRKINTIGDINMTPLIDVMLVLLVIFMLATPLVTQKMILNLPKEPPQKDGTDGKNDPKKIPPVVAIYINKAGEIFLSNTAEPVALAALERSLLELPESKNDLEIQLHADEQVPYGVVVDVMNAAQRSGLHKIGFLSELKDSPKTETMKNTKTD